jgi:hypothetical protein
VHGDGRSHGVDARRLERDVLGARDAVLDARMLQRLLDLLGAGVGGDDAIEVRGEPERGLAVARAAVPCQPSRRRDGGEPAEQLRGILRAMPRVVARELREMVFELAQSLPLDQGKK